MFTHLPIGGEIRVASWIRSIEWEATRVNHGIKLSAGAVVESLAVSDDCPFNLRRLVRFEHQIEIHLYTIALSFWTHMHTGTSLPV